MSNRIRSYNAFETTLNGGIDNSTLTATLTSVDNLPLRTWLVIDPDIQATREYVFVTGIDGGSKTITMTARGGTGQGNTGDIAHAHDSGAVLRAVAVHQWLDTIFDDIEAVEGDLSTHIPGTDPHTQYVKLAGDTMVGELSVPVAAPSGDAVAANKKYVDDQINALPPAFSGDHADLTNVLTDDHHTKYTDAEAQAVGDALYLPLSGGTISGNLTVTGDILTNEVRGRTAGPGTPIQIKTNDGVIRFSAADGVNTALLDSAGDVQLAVEQGAIRITGELSGNGSGIISNWAEINLFAGSDINMKDDASQSIRLQTNNGSGGFALTKISGTVFQIYSYTDGFACMEIDQAAKTITAVNGYSFV